MFNIGTPELILILVVALIILGPKRLPELAKSLGRGIREFQKAADDVKESLTRDIREEGENPDILAPGRIESAPPVEPPTEPVPEPATEPAPEPDEARAPVAEAPPRE